MFTKPLRNLAESILDSARQANLKIATAESCTGGLIVGLLTEIAGSSDVVDRGFVTYSNQAKTDMLGVTLDLLIDYGAVSEQVARAMAEGAVKQSSADLAVSVTGIAGPGGGSKTKPVGLVHFASARKGRETLHERHVFDGDRSAVRKSAVTTALKLLQRQLAN